MGRECVEIYDSFVWMPEVLADEDNGIANRPAEDRYYLDTVLTKFDHHFDVHNFRNIKRQEFLNSKRGQLSVMDYIEELQRKAEYCQYIAQKDGFICDMIINGDKRQKVFGKAHGNSSRPINIGKGDSNVSSHRTHKRSH
ncbi:hypothetical protein DPMN_062779 [Dreissena polymorpha]|uniref:Retrotransposon gag domain-containing protein n=1 Tax=Dreissena polymorpha TaxID=45954 RepID=A0A9D4CAA8_DREPO|nr:hypothetical protein DPMN_062779 [Dreissena polymorpha]